MGAEDIARQGPYDRASRFLRGSPEGPHGSPEGPSRVRQGSLRGPRAPPDGPPRIPRGSSWRTCVNRGVLAVVRPNFSDEARSPRTALGLEAPRFLAVASLLEQSALMAATLGWWPRGGRACTEKISWLAPWERSIHSAQPFAVVP